MKRTLLLILPFAVALLVAMVAPAVAGQKHPASASSKIMKARGPIPIVKKSLADMNKSSTKAHKPAKKGGTVSRGPNAWYELHVDNRTGYYITIYEDGEEVGTVAPYGDSYGPIQSGRHELFGRAPGVDLTVGPRTVYVDGDFKWTITP